jgi:trigger factor
MSAATKEMQVKREDLNECTIQLEIVCSTDQIDAAFKKAVKSLGKNLRIPGFRPGQAPLPMIEQSLPPQEVEAAAAEEAVKDAYKKAINEEGITPSGQPRVNLTKFEREAKACEFSIKIPLRPIIEIEGYKGLKAERPKIEVTDEEIDQQIEELRRRGGTQEKITDRGIETGDMSVVNIKPDEDGIEGRSFMMIAGQTFPQLDEEIAGMKTEEIKTVELTFPDTFQEQDWAGKKFKCDVTIRSVSGVNLPELDDEFAKSLRADNVDDLRSKVGAGLENAKSQWADDVVNEQLMDHILKTSKVVVPDTTWEAVAERRLTEMAQELQDNKSSLEDYAKEKGMSIEEMQEKLQDEAKMHVQRAVIIEHIFQEEKMEITDEHVNRHFLDLAQENNIKQEDLQQFAEQQGDAIREEVIFRTISLKPLRKRSRPRRPRRAPSLLRPPRRPRPPKSLELALRAVPTGAALFLCLGGPYVSGGTLSVLLGQAGQQGPHNGCECNWCTVRHRADCSRRKKLRYLVPSSERSNRLSWHADR